MYIYIYICITHAYDFPRPQEHLQVLSGILDVGRLVPCERYADLIPAFQRLLKTECNIPVLTEAAKCVYGFIWCTISSHNIPHHTIPPFNCGEA